MNTNIKVQEKEDIYPVSYPCITHHFPEDVTIILKQLYAIIGEKNNI